MPDKTEYDILCNQEGASRTRTYDICCNIKKSMKNPSRKVPQNQKNAKAKTRKNATARTP